MTDPILSMHARTNEPPSTELSDSAEVPLSQLFEPRRVALVGASERPGSVGRAVLENLLAFEGDVYLVNAKNSQLLGHPAYPDLASVPEVPDLVVIAVPAPTVPSVIRQCAERGVRAVVVLSAGFKECGAEGAALEQQVLAEAQRGGVRLLGPNCLGLMMPHLRLNATFGCGMARPGQVAFLSQSGALCTAILDWSARERVGFSAFVSMGSMVDVNWGDLITYFGDDPNTRSIVCYMESVGDARAFLSAAREVALTKPILILKVGHTEAAAKAAASHTGALTGSDAVLDAAFQRVGVLRVNSLTELFDMAEVLSKQPRPVGPRLAIVTNAGGPGALATDTLVASGARLAGLSEKTLKTLNHALPPQWSHGNPIDILGDADAVRASKAFDAAAGDEGVDGVLAILTPQAMTDPQAIAHELCAVARRVTKPVLASWMGGTSMEAGCRILNEAGIPTFDYPDTAARAFALMWRYTDQLRALYETPSEVAMVRDSMGGMGGAGDSRLGGTAAEWLRAIRSTGRLLLTEMESKRLLTAYGIPTVPTEVAFTPQEAVSKAKAMGFPVAIKLHSETLTHKAEVGGVRLNVRDAGGVLEAWEQIEHSVVEKAGAGHFLGVTVQAMAPGGGLELVLGSSVDPQFGPVLLFGVGGHWVEALRDTALGLPPLNTTLAKRLIEQTRLFSAVRETKVLQGIDLDALADVLVRFSYLVADLPWIAEMDVNPILAFPGRRLLAVDARVVLHPPGVKDAELPKPAIRPYPGSYQRSVTLRDGSGVTVRPIRPEDEHRMVVWHSTLSDRSVYLRYFTPLNLDQRVAHERLSRVCFVDYDREMVFVAERIRPGTAEREILGVARWRRLNGRPVAEFAVTVGDPWQGKGLGTQLVRVLMEVARAEGLQRLVGHILPDNTAMLRMVKEAGFEVEAKADGNGFSVLWNA